MKSSVIKSSVRYEIRQTNYQAQCKRIKSTWLHIYKTLYYNDYRKRKGTESMKVTNSFNFDDNFFNSFN